MIPASVGTLNAMEGFMKRLAGGSIDIGGLEGKNLGLNLFIRYYNYIIESAGDLERGWARGCMILVIIGTGARSRGMCGDPLEEASEA